MTKMTKIDETLIEGWTNALEEGLSRIEADDDTLEWFSQSVKYDEDKFNEAINQNQTKLFIQETIKEKQLEDIKVIEKHLLGKSYKTIQCVASQGTKYQLKLPKSLQLYVIQGSDCFLNSLLIASNMKGDMVYGLMESEFNTIALHMWNFLNPAYFDYTSEIQKDGVLGKRYFILKRFKPYEFFYAWRHMGEDEDKETFHLRLMNTVAKNKKRAQLEFNQWLSTRFGL